MFIRRSRFSRIRGYRRLFCRFIIFTFILWMISRSWRSRRRRAGSGRVFFFVCLASFFSSSKVWIGLLGLSCFLFVGFVFFRGFR